MLLVPTGKPTLVVDASALLPVEETGRGKVSRLVLVLPVEADKDGVLYTHEELTVLEDRGVTQIVVSWRFVDKILVSLDLGVELASPWRLSVLLSLPLTMGVARERLGN